MGAFVNYLSNFYKINLNFLKINLSITEFCQQYHILKRQMESITCAQYALYYISLYGQTATHRANVIPLRY